MSLPRYPLFVFIIFLALSFVVKCQADAQTRPGGPPSYAIEDEDVNRMYELRAWQKAEELTFDPIEYAKEAHIPIEDAKARIVGSSYEDSVMSLAVKIWLIDHAEHSVDAGYYIFKNDLVGSAFLGALCQAVQRGVDVRLLVDSVGSLHPLHPSLKAFETCTDSAGYMINGNGLVTTRKARAQPAIFNAVSKVFVNHNRRSHDKLLIIDGAFPDKSWIMTGGRNISLSYYGFRKDGSKDLSAYKDMEILIKPKNLSGMTNTVGQTT
ncbi:MAG: phospholipase D-like domain-containing protein, partial [Desulfocapsaceae bacterium]